MTATTNGYCKSFAGILFRDFNVTRQIRENLMHAKN